MADQQAVQEQAQKTLDAVLSTGDHTEGGAAVDEHVAAEAQKLDRSTDPVGELQASEEKAEEVKEPASADEAAPEPVDDAEVPSIAPPAFAGESATVAPVTASEVHDAPALPVEEKPSSGTAEEEKKEEKQEEENEEENAGEKKEEEQEEKKEETEAEKVSEEPKEAVVGTKRPAEEAAEGEDELAAKIAKYEVDPSDPNAEYFRLIAEIPSGETRTFTDIALGAGAKATMARSIGRTLAKVASEDPGLPWWRVVSAMGALQSNPERQELQLERLRAEGARPREDEGVADWAARVGAKIVGTYALGSLRMVHAEADNDDVSTFNPHCVEPFPSKEAASARGFSRMI